MLYSLCNKVLCYGVESAEKPRCRVFFFLCALDFASYRERFEKLWCASPFCVLRYFIFVPAYHQRDIYARKQGQGLLLFYGLARYTFESRIRKPRKGLRFKPILGALWKTPSKIGVFAVCFRILDISRKITMSRRKNRFDNRFVLIVDPLRSRWVGMISPRSQRRGSWGSPAGHLQWAFHNRVYGLPAPQAPWSRRYYFVSMWFSDSILYQNSYFVKRLLEKI